MRTRAENMARHHSDPGHQIMAMSRAKAAENTASAVRLSLTHWPLSMETAQTRAVAL
jgi:hypothetical protein